MSGRIWPGALCVVVSCRGKPENVGAVRTATERDPFAPFEAWFLSPPLPNGDDAIDARCLVPITPPPGTARTEDRAPCELQPGESVGV